MDIKEANLTRTVQLGWLYALVEYLEKPKFMQEIKQCIEDEETFDKAYNEERNKVNKMTEDDILDTAKSFALEMSEYNHTGMITKKMDFISMYRELWREEQEYLKNHQ